MRTASVGSQNIMSPQSIPQQCAQNALEQLLRDAKEAQETRDAAFEYLDETSAATKKATEEVKRQWFAVSI